LLGAALLLAVGAGGVLADQVTLRGADPGQRPPEPVKPAPDPIVVP
jgi:hypothetical protein